MDRPVTDVAARSQARTALGALAQELPTPLSSVMNEHASYIGGYSVLLTNR